VLASLAPSHPFRCARRYRPTVICLLPHVKNIDSKSLPRRGAGGGGGGGAAAYTHSSPAKQKIQKKAELEKTRIKAQKQAEADKKRSTEWKAILKSRSTEPEYAKPPEPSGKKLRPDEVQALVSKLNTPIYEPKQRIDPNLTAGKLAFGRAIPLEDVLQEIERKREERKNNGNMNVAALKAKMAGRGAGGAGGGKKGVAAGKGRGSPLRAESKGMTSGGETFVNHDIEMLHQVRAVYGGRAKRAQKKEVVGGPRERTRRR
jgi:hypothetical protein